MKETELYKKVNKLLAEHGFYGERVENLCAAGTPDAFFQGSCALWAENKTLPATKNKREYVRPKWRPGQIGWAERHINHGGLWVLFIAIGSEILYITHPAEEYLYDDLVPFAWITFSETLKRHG